MTVWEKLDVRLCFLWRPAHFGRSNRFLETQGTTRQFWPEALVIVDEFPMTPSGKVQKYKLRQYFFENS